MHFTHNTCQKQFGGVKRAYNLLNQRKRFVDGWMYSFNIFYWYIAMCWNSPGSFWTYVQYRFEC
jgi:hypothetical protein